MSKCIDFGLYFLKNQSLMENSSLGLEFGAKIPLSLEFFKEGFKCFEESAEGALSPP